MKKTSVILLTYLLIGIAVFIPLNTFAPLDIHGHANTLELMREVKSKHYKDAVLLHTEECEDRFIDFVFSENDNMIKVVSIKRRAALYGERYNTTQMIGKGVENFLLQYNDSFYADGQIKWQSTSNETFGDFKPIYWSLLHPNDKINEENIDTYAVDIQGKPYILCIK